MNWAEEELSGISLGNARLDRRTGKLVASMANRPTSVRRDSRKQGSISADRTRGCGLA
ncbi:MAG: hypothetical protein H7315_04485 [Herminiimonas sp.]|nr:hypothetical protein [Herminiimonas sp.]